MRIFYRGYVINEDTRTIGYSVLGQRPERLGLTVRSTTREAMEWIDSDVKRSSILRLSRTLQPSAH